tara:strand:+ start:273 stop:530 length:258 start_codon:yes stop_codon:yes gene_type:complete
VPYPPDGQAYKRLAQAVLLSAVRDAELWTEIHLRGTWDDPTPTRRVTLARQFLVTEEECGGWCQLADLDTTAFIERMKAQLGTQS